MRARRGDPSTAETELVEGITISKLNWMGAGCWGASSWAFLRLIVN